MVDGENMEGAFSALSALQGRRVVVTLAVLERPLCRVTMQIEDAAMDDGRIVVSGDYEETDTLVHYSEVSLPVPEDEEGEVHWSQVGQEILIVTSDGMELRVVPT